MKLYFLSLPIIFLFLIGCSRTYRVTNYFSKEDLYKKANSSMSIRDVNVVTVDSSFIALEGSRIKDDSLQVVSRTKEKIPLTDVKHLSYTNHWIGLGTGSFAGMLTGFTIGYIGVRSGDWVGRGGSGTFVLSTIAGTIVGAIVGAIIGWDYNYQFGP